MFEMKKTQERVILVAVQEDDRDDTLESVRELGELARTAGAVVVGEIVQKREYMHPGTYLGKGKLEELSAMIWETESSGIICDDELSPAQFRNLESILDCKVMDRTMLILDIFAARAQTSEGKLQVEMAQLKYRQARLTGQGINLSRLGGGIGTRGPGEKKLETDRRLIRSRIAKLRRELEEVEEHRGLLRTSRERSQLPLVAIVGYTNAGKSTLLNALTNAGIFAEDLLFATLDTTVRSVELPKGQVVLLSDTVGFIRKLPHHLIQAFRSTLEETCFADVILHVVDASNPEMEQQMAVVYDTLETLEVKGKPIITVFNKGDRLSEETKLRDFRADHSIRISAKYGNGLEELKALIEEVSTKDRMEVERVFPYTEAGKIQIMRKYGNVEIEEYRDEGIYVKGKIPKDLYAKVVY